MYKEIVPILKCPLCKENIEIEHVYNRVNEEIIDALLNCKHNHHFAVRDGVINFNVQEQQDFNNWSKLYEEKDYASIDQYITQHTPENEKALNDLTKQYILAYIHKNKPPIILDLATGRAMLASYLIQSLAYNPTIICTDLSFTVLKYDRLKMKSLNPNIKINFIACDCSNLPLYPNTIDCVTSFYGISNMSSLYVDGIKEANRILKKQCTLLDTYLTLEHNTKIIKTLNEIKEKFGDFPIEKVSFSDLLNKIHQAIFHNTKETIIGEGIGEKRQFDLIPIEGEKFTISLFECQK